MVHYDEHAVRLLVPLESAVRRLRHPNQPEFTGILNAIELHLEGGDGTEEIARLLGQALLALARYRSLAPNQLSALERHLKKIYAHLRPAAELAPAEKPEDGPCRLSGTLSPRGGS